jgi:hypothetical protein
MAVQSKEWTTFAHSNTGVVGSNPTWGIDVNVHLFCVYVVLCVKVVALWQADPRPRSPNDYAIDQGPEKRPRSKKGCRKIDR